MTELYLALIPVKQSDPWSLFSTKYLKKNTFWNSRSLSKPFLEPFSTTPLSFPTSPQSQRLEAPLDLRRVGALQQIGEESQPSVVYQAYKASQSRWLEAQEVERGPPPNVVCRNTCSCSWTSWKSGLLPGVKLSGKITYHQLKKNLKIPLKRESVNPWRFDPILPHFPNRVVPPWGPANFTASYQCGGVRTFFLLASLRFGCGLGAQEGSEISAASVPFTTIKTR